MCRFVSYFGSPLLMSDLLFEPENSLIKQSIHANDTDVPLNGDGFGVGWYASHTNPAPGLFVSVRPAWNDQNLKYIAPKILSHCFLAHVRAASVGIVSEINCHPFHQGDFLFMHNGGIGGFEKIKRTLINQLSDQAFLAIKGQTDSEHFFSLFMDTYHSKPHEPDDVNHLADAFEETIRRLHVIKKDCGVHEVDYINAVITNGKVMLGIRYVSDKRYQPVSMYYSEGKQYTCKDGVCYMDENGPEKAILIVSERLSKSPADWHAITENTMILVGPGLKVSQRTVKIQ
jgi:predicted glutamine amidotransferase